MSKILAIITAQRFELIRDRIAQILAIELAEQLSLTSNALFSAVVWKERFVAFDKTELPSVNVRFNSSDYLEKTPITSKANNSYMIDVEVLNKDSVSGYGDTLASEKCHKLLGVIRYILENPNYINLEFENPRFIFTTKVTNIQVYQPDNQDGTNSTSGRIMFEVTAEELNGELTATPGEEYTTQIKLDQTEKGFFYKIIN